MKKKEKVNKSLYEDNHPETSTKGTGFKDKQKALDTLKIIKDRDLTYQKQVINTMFNRAKHHPHQTENMKEAMKVFDDWLKKNK
jgi:aromatic ring hydroxylase